MKKSVKHQAILFFLLVFISSCASVTTYQVIDSNFKLHHYNRDDYKDLALLKVGTTTKLYCTKHDVLEDIKVRHIHLDGRQDTQLTVSDPYPIQDAPEQDTFNSQRD